MGKLLTRDVTVVSTLAQSCITAAARGRGEAAELAAARKCEKYAEISTAYTFLPIAVETLGPMNESAYLFFEDLAKRICDVLLVTAAKYLSFSSGSQSPFSASMRLSIAKHSFCTMIWASSHSTFLFLISYVCNPWDLYYQW